MLLNDLLTLAELGAQKPFSMWKAEFELTAPRLTDALSSVYGELEEGTEVKRDVGELLSLLKEPTPNEYDLARAFLSVSEIFSGEDDEHQDLFQSYHAAVKAFYGRAQSAEFHARERSRLTSSLSSQEQAAYDERLFNQEGMMYVLEFYLELYKAIQDAPSEERKRVLIEHREVKLAFGRVPGLWADVASDEILEKFVYKMLNDRLREEILQGYYDFKEVLMKLRVSCDQEGSCTGTYDRVSLAEVMASFKTFLERLLEVFQKAGIMRLKSAFFKPYGNNPNLKDILL
ncbi:TPA: hypothetical protein DDZ10_00900 [Candidatus Uhrbacteria bacterium]|nr:MAG: hypothetical protein A3D69_00345 [Candidatus Uhrbacteria bacterium RIFCSPHIGHO2_02_FULL_54_11]HBL39212.1 hypothetical protein [Candidatus Uhrbacteria bacterium]